MDSFLLPMFRQVLACRSCFAERTFLFPEAHYFSRDEVFTNNLCTRLGINDSTNFTYYAYSILISNATYQTATFHFYSVSNIVLINTFIMRMILTSSWKDVVLITEDGSGFDAEEYGLLMKTVNLGCTSRFSEIIYLLNQWIPIEDYMNIIIWCSFYITKQINLILSGLETNGARLNCVIITNNELPLSVERARDGDNFVLVSTRNILVSQTILSTHIAVLEYNTDVTASYCLISCHKPDSEWSRVSLNEDTLNNLVALPGRFIQFYGHELQIVTITNNKNYWSYKTLNGDSAGEYDGVMVEIVKYLALAFNFSYSISDVDDERYGSPGKNGSFDGGIGMVQQGFADMFAADVDATAIREEAVDFLYPADYSRSQFIIKIPFEKNTYFVDPLDWPTWLIAGCLFGATSLTIELIYFVDKRMLSRHSHKCGLGFLDAMRIFFNQGGERRFPTYSQYFVTGFLMFGALSLWSVYMGNLTANLAVPKPNMPFTTVHELAKRPDYRVYTVNSSSQMTYLKQSKSEAMQEIWAQMWRDRDFTLSVIPSNILSLVQEQTKTVTFVPSNFFESVRSASGYCELVPLDDIYNPVPVAIAIRQGSPYLRSFSDKMIVMHEAGLIEFWKKKHRHKLTDLCASFDRYQRYNITAVTLHDLSLVLTYTLCYPLIIASVIFVIEIIIKVWVKLKATLY